MMTPFAMLLTMAMIGQAAPAATSTDLHGPVGTIGRIKGPGKDAFLLRDPVWLKDFLIAAKDANQGGEGAVNSLNLMIEDRKLTIVPGGSRIRVVNLKRRRSTNEIFAEVEILSDEMKGTRGWLATGQLETLPETLQSLPAKLSIDAGKAAYRDAAGQLAKLRSKLYPGNKNRASAAADRDMAKLQTELMVRYSLKRAELNALMECGKANQWDNGTAKPAKKEAR